MLKSKWRLWYAKKKVIILHLTPMFMVMFLISFSRAIFIYWRSKYFVSRRIKHKQSLLPEHYLNVIFDVDGTTEDSSGRLNNTAPARLFTSLSARTSARKRITSHAFSLTHSIHSRIKTYLLLPLTESVHFEIHRMRIHVVLQPC